ncbi:MAG: ABC transporter permease [Bacteroidales bacterium]|nr:ABC transporter permease [Bacteroidales bacterium]MBN2761535.1 ABC transporter permease [Bacteroidales bacterium]
MFEKLYKRYIHDFYIAVDSLLDNKLKTVLTGLGIIFGVAAVISMLAVGRGAKEEILEQIKLVGVNNIVISPIVEARDESDGSSSGNSNAEEKRKYSPGLTLEDVETIKDYLPAVKSISPEIAINSFVTRGGFRESSKILGVSQAYFDIYNLKLEMGDIFNSYHEENGIPVCVIGSNIRAKFFSKVNPINQYIKFGNIWLKVIGVIEKSNVSVSGFENAGVNVFNDNIYVPVKTLLMRLQNRALINTRTFTSQSGNFPGMARSVTPKQNTEGNYHQLDRIIVQVYETQQLSPAAEVLSRMMHRRHMQVKDYEITIPEMLLKQEQRTKDVFNIVLGAIASIALIVGGIGIMNIMFASVMERIKEIGTRMAIGAKKTDIVVQFLSEAVLISVTGGLIGVMLGIILAEAIEKIFDIRTIVTLSSVMIAFVVSASVGIIFGYSPAKRASEKDPIESLRYE